MYSILIIGEGRRTDELLAKIANNAKTTVISETDFSHQDLSAYQLVFEMNADRTSFLPIDYTLFPDTLFLHSAVYNNLPAQHPENIIGFNALAGFINRDLMEVSSVHEHKKTAFSDMLSTLGWETAWVQNRVGMVTPRIVCMIINEAYYTLQEGTANKSDIDTGMKLGTNYPHGPFEWFEKIGGKDVYDLLEAMYEDTKDERYKICPLLKTEALG